MSFFSGGMTLTRSTATSGKFSPAALAAAIGRMKDHVPHTGQPVAVSLTEITELGALYRPRRGARRSPMSPTPTAAPSTWTGPALPMRWRRLGCSPADITWRAGVDVLSFGGTKNGCLAAEAVVFFDPAPARDALFQRQRAGQGFSKNWFIAAQFDAYLDGTVTGWSLPATPMRWRRDSPRQSQRSPNARLALEAGRQRDLRDLVESADGGCKAAGAVYYPWPAETLPADEQPGPDEVAGPPDLRLADDSGRRRPLCGRAGSAHRPRTHKEERPASEALPFDQPDAREATRRPGRSAPALRWSLLIAMRARLHGLGNVAHEVDVKQAVLQRRALHFDVVGELEAALEGARGDAAIEELAFLLLLAGLLLALHGEHVLLRLRSRGRPRRSRRPPWSRGRRSRRCARCCRADRSGRCRPCPPANRTG